VVNCAAYLHLCTVIHSLLSAGDVQLERRDAKNGFMPLALAVAAGRHAACVALLVAGANADARDRYL